MNPATYATAEHPFVTTPAVQRAAGQRRPLPPTLSVREALSLYLGENGFDTASYTAPTFEFEAFGRRYTLPNSPERRRAVPLHDLHHMATGYGTDLVGEAEIGAWELVGGCRTPTVYLLNLLAMSGGLLLAPLRTLRALRDARGARALYRHDHDYDALLDLSLGELRARLGIPVDGLASRPQRLHDEAEQKRPDALPSAPPLPGWAALLASATGLATLGTVAWELARGRTLEGALLTSAGMRGFSVGVAALSALLAASAPSARRGSLSGRALAGGAAVGLVAASLYAAASLGFAAPLAAAAILPLLAVLGAMAKE
jgi:hypothetical protein